MSKGDPIPPEVGAITSASALQASYYAFAYATAAYRAAYADLASGRSTFTAICEASDRMRAIATFAVAMGAPEWEDWAG